VGAGIGRWRRGLGRGTGIRCEIVVVKVLWELRLWFVLEDWEVGWKWCLRCYWRCLFGRKVVIVLNLVEAARF